MDALVIASISSREELSAACNRETGNPNLCASLAAAAVLWGGSFLFLGAQDVAVLVDAAGVVCPGREAEEVPERTPRFQKVGFLFNFFFSSRIASKGIHISFVSRIRQ